ncbi:MAG: cysteine desulfurase family protein, partial [Gemmataceae bacterium]
MLNLDHNATAPLRTDAFEAMRPWLTGPAGNPASAHAAGRRARRALEDAREEIAALLGAFPDEVIFTSGATEANNLALFGLAGEPPGRILASPIEHPCVIEPLQQLAGRGFTVEWLPVTSDGIVEPVPPAHDDTRLVAVMLANHEIGAIQPISALSTQYSASFHCDAAQAVGKIAVNFHDLNIASMSLSGHKFGGPVGIGLMLLNRCAKLRPLLFGGHQQQGRRPGTEPVALAVGLATALKVAVRDLSTNRAHVSQLRERFLARLQADAAPMIVNGNGVRHILNVSFPGCLAEGLLMALDLAGVSCSAGSECSSGSLLPSPVL